MIQTLKKHWTDKLGILSATLCMIHCLSLPVLMSMGVGFLDNPFITSLFVFIAFISIYNSPEAKVSKQLTLFLWVAFGGFVLSLLLEEKAKLFEYGTYLFSIAIIVGHLIRIKYNEAI